MNDKSFDNFKMFITDSLEKYDNNSDYYSNMFKNVYSVQYIGNNSEIDYNKAVFYDKDGRKIIEANYEVIGTFYIEKATWVWSWSDANFKKKMVNRSKNMLLYGLKLDPEENFSLKLELINSRFLISDPIQIDIHLAIASEITKTPCIFKMPVPIPAEDIETEEFLGPESDEMKLRIFKDLDDINRFKFVYLFLFDVLEV
jgi:hypothetical protein